MDIYNYDDYKKYIKKWLSAQPKRGHGLSAKIAEHVGISTVLVSQILNGDKNLSLEHALLLTDFLNLTSDEQKYFLLLVNYEKAGSQKLKIYFKKEIIEIQKLKTESLKEIIPTDATLNEADKAIFYSSWLYSTIRLLTSIPKYQNLEALYKKLLISKNELTTKMEFLLEKKLCIKENGQFTMGPQRTHLEASSPYIKTRQISWRVKGFEKMDNNSSTNLFYTAPMSISQNQFLELRKRINILISELNQNVISEKPDKIACLNIDLFDIFDEA